MSFNLNSEIHSYFCLSLFIFFLSSCTVDIEKVNKLIGRDTVVVDYANDLEIVYTDSGHVSMVMKTKKALDYNGEKEKKLRRFDFIYGGVISTFKKDTVDLIIKADSIIHYTSVPETHLFKNVILKNKYGDVLETDTLVWYRERDEVESNTEVYIDREDQQWYGKHGLYAKVDFSYYELRGIKGEIEFEKNKRRDTTK